MSFSYRRTAVFLSLILLTACQSDADRLSKLQTEKLVQCLNAEALTGKLEATHDIKSPYRDSLLREWSKYDTRCQLATRDLNRFMR